MATLDFRAALTKEALADSSTPADGVVILFGNTAPFDINPHVYILNTNGSGVDDGLNVIKVTHPEAGSSWVWELQEVLAT